MFKWQTDDYYKYIKEPYIIAEVGSTWKGKNDDESLHNCIRCVELAAEYGASAVKFQLFNHAELYGIDGDNSFALPRGFIPPIANSAHDLSIDFLCSAFSLAGYDFIDTYVKMHKVASSMVGDLDVITKLDRQKKPVLVSDGMFDVPFGGPWIPMICASEYPAQTTSYNLMSVWEYAIRSKNGWGLSDHTTGSFIGPLFRANGCTYFEKHVNFMGKTDNPDYAVSLSSEQFGLYCDAIRKIEVGRPTYCKLSGRRLWGNRWDKEKKGYYRPKA